MMLWIIISYVAGVFAMAVVLGLREPHADNTVDAILISAGWPFVVVQIAGFLLGQEFARRWP